MVLFTIRSTMKSLLEIAISKTQKIDRYVMVKLELFGRTRIFSSEEPESLTVGASLNIHGLFFY